MPQSSRPAAFGAKRPLKSLRDSFTSIFHNASKAIRLAEPIPVRLGCSDVCCFQNLIDKFVSNSSEVFSIKPFITFGMIAFMLFLLAAGTALVFLLAPAPPRGAVEREQHAPLPANELERWRP
jgi:hypothetical protein